MIYIYDILLNFNNNLIEYFEWDEKDNIKFIKKVTVFKIKNNDLKNIIDNKIKLNKTFTNKIYSYEMNGSKNETKICILTNGKIAIGILIKNDIVIKLSRMLLDEEQEVLELINDEEYTNIEYEILEKKEKINSRLTRKETKIKTNLKKELTKLHKSNKEIILYLFYEYTSKESHNLKKSYDYLQKSLNDFNEKHIYLYNLIKQITINT